MTWNRIGLLTLLCLLTTNARSQTNNASSATGAAVATAKAPCGMTNQQADKILVELKEIHNLLEKIQRQGGPGTAATAIGPPTERVKMTVASGWFSLGRADAPVTIVEFTDYQCPYCKRFQNDTFPDLRKNYIDKGKVRFISRDLPLASHQYAMRAAVAALCAGDQKKYWELRDAMIANAPDLAKESIRNYAATLSLDMAVFDSCLEADTYKTQVQNDSAAAAALGISGTPSFVIGKTATDQVDGDRIVGALPISVFDAEIQKFLMAKP